MNRAWVWTYNLSDTTMYHYTTPPREFVVKPQSVPNPEAVKQFMRSFPTHKYFNPHRKITYPSAPASFWHRGVRWRRSGWRPQPLRSLCPPLPTRPSQQPAVRMHNAKVSWSSRARVTVPISAREGPCVFSIWMVLLTLPELLRHTVRTNTGSSSPDLIHDFLNFRSSHHTAAPRWEFCGIPYIVVYKEW